jgi:hypothetical protein
LLNISSHGNEKQQRGYIPVKLIDIRWILVSAWYLGGEG